MAPLRVALHYWALINKTLRNQTRSFYRAVIPRRRERIGRLFRRSWNARRTAFIYINIHVWIPLQPSWKVYKLQLTPYIYSIKNVKTQFHHKWLIPTTQEPSRITAAQTLQICTAASWLPVPNEDRTVLEFVCIPYKNYVLGTLKCNRSCGVICKKVANNFLKNRPRVFLFFFVVFFLQILLVYSYGNIFMKFQTYIALKHFALNRYAAQFC